jgi:acyl carrier protein
MDTRSTLADLAVREFGCDPGKIAAGLPIREVGIDSLGMLEFIFRIEEVFGIEIGNEQAEKLVTLTDLAVLVDQLRAAVKQ